MIKEFLAKEYGWTFKQIDEMDYDDIKALYMRLDRVAKERERERLEDKQKQDARKNAQEMSRRGY